MILKAKVYRIVDWLATSKCIAETQLMLVFFKTMQR